MPQVVDPDKVAASNRDYFVQGMGAIGEGITKAGENRRADEKQKWLEDKDYRDFQHKLAQDRLAQMNENRNYFLRHDQYNLNKAKQDYDIGRTTRQDEWLEKIYDQYVGSSDPFESEYESLREELSHLEPWQLKILMGD